MLYTSCLRFVFLSACSVVNSICDFRGFDLSHPFAQFEEQRIEQWQMEWAQKGEERALAHRKMLEAVLKHPDNDPERALQKSLKVGCITFWWLYGFISYGNFVIKIRGNAPSIRTRILVWNLRAFVHQKLQIVPLKYVHNFVFDRPH